MMQYEDIGIVKITQHLTGRQLLFCSQALHGRPHQTETFWGPSTSRVRLLLCHRVCNHAEVKEGQERYEVIYLKKKKLHSLVIFIQPCC